MFAAFMDLVLGFVWLVFVIGMLVFSTLMLKENSGSDPLAPHRDALSWGLWIFWMIAIAGIGFILVERMWDAVNTIVDGVGSWLA